MVEYRSFTPTHCAENWLQSGISLGKTHYHLTEQCLTPGCACSWMDLGGPTHNTFGDHIEVLEDFPGTSVQTSNILLLLHSTSNIKCISQCCVFSSWEIHAGHLLQNSKTVRNVELAYIGRLTIACSTLAYIGKLPLHADRVRYASLVVFVLRLVHGPRMRNFCDFYQISCWPHSVLKCQQNTKRPDILTPGTSKAHCGA
jgi:hypothetical protein